MSTLGGLLSKKFPSISVVGAKVSVGGQGDSRITPLQSGVAKVSNCGIHEAVDEHQAQPSIKAQVSHDVCRLHDGRSDLKKRETSRMRG